MAIQFTNKDVADKFDCTLEKDVTVRTKGYVGKVSGINLVGAQHLLKSNTGYVKTKEQAATENAAGDNNGNATGSDNTDTGNEQ